MLLPCTPPSAPLPPFPCSVSSPSPLFLLVLGGAQYLLSCGRPFLRHAPQPAPTPMPAAAGGRALCPSLASVLAGVRPSGHLFVSERLLTLNPPPPSLSLNLSRVDKDGRVSTRRSGRPADSAEPSLRQPLPRVVCAGGRLHLQEGDEHVRKHKCRSCAQSRPAVGLETIFCSLSPFSKMRHPSLPHRTVPSFGWSLSLLCTHSTITRVYSSPILNFVLASPLQGRILGVLRTGRLGERFPRRGGGGNVAIRDGFDWIERN